jgi:hypothetical protein
MPRKPGGDALTGAERAARYRQRQREAGRVLGWSTDQSLSPPPNTAAAGTPFDPDDPISMLAHWDATIKNLQTVQRAIKRWVASYEPNSGVVKTDEFGKRLEHPIEIAAAKVDERGLEKLERIKSSEPGALARFVRPRSRATRWEGAVQELRALIEEYDQWLENLPDAIRLAGTALVVKLEEMVQFANAIDELEAADLPIGWGRD